MDLCNGNPTRRLRPNSARQPAGASACFGSRYGPGKGRSVAGAGPDSGGSESDGRRGPGQCRLQRSAGVQTDRSTSLSYATNTTDKVIKVGDVYYLCLQGIWFMSTTPQGPWKTAPSVPQQIYTIPASSPVYNVTYVTQTTTPSGSVQSSYTAGYMGTFLVGLTVGVIIANGSGYYYPPYIYRPIYGYPIYHPYPVTYGYGSYYNHYSGAYGVAHGVYGPYHGATGWASYNPYTGTYARGGSVYGPYGSASAGRAYNPYTGAYARGGTVSTPYGSRARPADTNNILAWSDATGMSPYGPMG